jgi:hypothetical protein
MYGEVAARWPATLSSDIGEPSTAMRRPYVGGNGYSQTPDSQSLLDVESLSLLLYDMSSRHLLRLLVIPSVLNL